MDEPPLPTADHCPPGTLVGYCWSCPRQFRPPRQSMLRMLRHKASRARDHPQQYVCKTKAANSHEQNYANDVERWIDHQRITPPSGTSTLHAAPVAQLAGTGTTKWQARRRIPSGIRCSRTLAHRGAGATARCVKLLCCSQEVRVPHTTHTHTLKRIHGHQLRQQHQQGRSRESVRPHTRS